MKHVQKEIPVDSLVVDSDNPRFFHWKYLEGRDNITQEQMLSEIGDDPEIKRWIKSIRKEGVKDPIWVKPIQGNRYLVIEGNRRTYILKQLCEKDVEPPEGVRYDVVTANVVDKDATKEDLLVLKITLQTGKKTWGAFNKAASTYRLSNVHLMNEKDIADRSLISVREVKERIADFELFQEYSKETGNKNPKWFSYFSEIPKRVRNWIDQNERNKEIYFDLITPDPETGIQRLRSIATKGGVRDFSKILTNDAVLEAFLKDKEMTVEEGLELLKEKDIWKKYKWLKRAKSLAGELSLLGKEDIQRISSEKKALNALKRLHRATSLVLEKLDQNGDE